jgi:hypothetical protein
MQQGRKTAKYSAIGWTIVYVILFPLFMYIALLSGMLFENPKTTVPIGLTMMFVMFWIPLSMPISVYLMWFNFSHHKYNRTIFLGLLPLLTFIVALLLVDGILPLFSSK